MSRTCKICWTILAVFFVGNLVLLTLWLMSTNQEINIKNTTSRNYNEAKQRMRKHFMEQADLDTIQYEEFTRLRNQHMKVVNQYEKKIDSLKILLMNQTFSGNNDTLMVMTTIDEIAEQQKNIEWLNFRHYKAIRYRCRNEEQRQKLDQTFKHLMDKPRGRHRRGRGPRNN